MQSAPYWTLPGVPEAVPGIWGAASSNAGGSLCLVFWKSPGEGLRASEPNSLQRTEVASWSAPSWVWWAEPSTEVSVDRREGIQGKSGLGIEIPGIGSSAHPSSLLGDCPLAPDLLLPLFLAWEVVGGGCSGGIAGTLRSSEPRAAAYRTTAAPTPDPCTLRATLFKALGKVHLQKTTIFSVALVPHTFHPALAVLRANSRPQILD